MKKLSLASLLENLPWQPETEELPPVGDRKLSPQQNDFMSKWGNVFSPQDLQRLHQEVSLNKNKQGYVDISDPQLLQKMSQINVEDFAQDFENFYGMNFDGFSMNQHAPQQNVAASPQTRQANYQRHGAQNAFTQFEQPEQPMTQAQQNQETSQWSIPQKQMSLADVTKRAASAAQRSQEKKTNPGTPLTKKKGR